MLLPPQFRETSSPPQQAAAELAGDRLAQEIEAAGIVRRWTANSCITCSESASWRRNRRHRCSVTMPWSRLEIDAGRLVPESVLSVIDLSTGNVLEQETLGWPLREADVSPMLAPCRKVLKGVGRPAAGKLRVLAAAGN